MYSFVKRALGVFEGEYKVGSKHAKSVLGWWTSGYSPNAVILPLRRLRALANVAQNDKYNLGAPRTGFESGCDSCGGCLVKAGPCQS